MTNKKSCFPRYVTAMDARPISCLQVDWMKGSKKVTLTDEPVTLPAIPVGQLAGEVITHTIRRAAFQINKL